jgi:hypothetical protein
MAKKSMKWIFYYKKVIANSLLIIPKLMIWGNNTDMLHLKEIRDG